MSYAPAAFLKTLGYCLFERVDKGSFVALSDPPPWFIELWGDIARSKSTVQLAQSSPFLENFLFEAEDFWQSCSAQMVDSGIWIEKTPSNKEIPLQALAWKLGAKSLLSLHSPDPQYQEQVQILQIARSSLLNHEKLVREVQKKEILLHTIVHDLSQPLSAMRGSLDCIREERDPDTIRKFIDLGRSASEQQESMIREILQAFSADLQASLDAQTQPNMAPSILATAQDTVATMSPAFAAKGVTLSLQLNNAQVSDWTVRGEQTRLRRIFANLLENALRYTPAGRHVTVALEQDAGFRKAYIDDEGPGLPRDLRPDQIFALFSKGKESAGKAGLGLYFCRITVERWGGSIGCASLPEKGSRFWFRLPPAVAPTRTLEGVTPKKVAMSEPSRTTPLRILLAEDQEDVRTLTVHQLERSGHRVMAVADGESALNAAHASEFDLILLDEEMPVLTGIQVARALRRDPREHKARRRIIALTGNNSPEDRDRLLAIGFDAVLGKPYRMEALDDLLGDVTPASAEGEAETNSREDLLQRVGGDEKLLVRMIRTFLRETPKRLAEIDRCTSTKDGAGLASCAHALKGSVSIFNGRRAREHSEDLQQAGKAANFRDAAAITLRLKEEIANLQGILRGYLPQAKTKTGASGRKSDSAPSKPGKHRKS